MAKFHLTRKAVGDLSEIWDYTLETWSEHQAGIYYRQLIETCQELATHHEMARYYDDITPQLRGYRSMTHVIFYRTIATNEIEIIRILHRRMDLKSKF